MNFEIHNLNLFSNEEEAVNFHNALVEKAIGCPGLDAMTVFLTEEETGPRVRQAIMDFSFGLRLALIEDKETFWNTIELCPQCKSTVRKNVATVCDACGHFDADLLGDFAFSALLAPNYDSNTFSTIAKESRQYYDQLAVQLALRIESVGNGQAVAEQAGRAIVAVLRRCLESWAAPNGIILPFEGGELRSES